MSDFDDDVRLTLDSAQPVDDLLKLADWLRLERALQGRVRVIATPPSDGELGPAVDLVTVALGSGGVGTVLASSITSWLLSRRKAVKIRLTVTRSDRTLEIETDNADEAEALVRRFIDDRDGI